MIELFGALVAGVLTTLAPCVLPLLPVIVGGSMAGALAEERAESGRRRRRRRDHHAHGGHATRSAVTRALVITISLGLSILVFTLALKATTALIGIPPQAWQWVSGGVLIALGVVGAFPDLWERLSARLGLQSRSATKLGAARQRDGLSSARSSPVQPSVRSSPRARRSTGTSSSPCCRPSRCAGWSCWAPTSSGCAPRCC